MLSCLTHTDILYAIAFFTSPSPQGPTIFIILSNSSQFHRSSNSYSYSPQPPTHQPQTAQCRLSPLLSVERNCASPDSRDQRPSEGHMCHFLFSAPIREEMEAACANTCILTRTHRHISVHLKHRGRETFSLLQQMATMPQAKSKSGQHTNNCCQGREA